MPLFFIRLLINLMSKSKPFMKSLNLIKIKKNLLKISIYYIEIWRNVRI